MSNKLARGYLFWFVLFWLTAAAYAWHEYDEHRRPTCEQVETEMFAFQQCLKYAPSCGTRSVEDFIWYYENKNWAQENCPDSGDGFLSQPKR